MPFKKVGRNDYKRKCGRKVSRTRNGGTWSEARYWSQVRSCLRRGFRFWKPIQDCLKAARIAKDGPRGAKWAFRCASCGGYFLRKNVQVDHIVECGSLNKPEDLAGFLERLTAESPDAYQVLCKTCHNKKTHKKPCSATET